MLEPHILNMRIRLKTRYSLLYDNFIFYITDYRISNAGYRLSCIENEVHTRLLNG